MKICWDNLEKMEYISHSGEWRKFSGINKNNKKCYHYYIYKEKCKNCRNPYLSAKYGNSNFCSKNCSQKGNNNNFNNFNKNVWPKGFKIATSREAQPELRQMVLKRDNYTCQKCNKHQDELKTGLHCHHIEGIRWEPLESADMDKCITLCKNCHKAVHKIEGCNYNDMKCKEVL